MLNRRNVSVLDCGDSLCEFSIDKSGQRTNGGCRCLQTILDHELKTKLRLYIAELKAEVSNLRAALNEK